MVAKGDIVQYFFDNGRGGCFIYGIVQQAGPKRFTVLWESKLRNRRPQNDHLVTLVPAGSNSMEIACEELTKAGLLPAKIPPEMV